MFTKTSSKLVASAVLAAVLLSVSACSSTGTTSGAAASCSATKSGASSDKVKVTGDAGKAAATFDSPLTASSTERTELRAGTGTVAVKGSTVSVNIAVYNGTTGAVIPELATPEGTPQDIKLEDPLIPGVSKALLCSSAGSRVVAVIPPDEGFGEQGADIKVSATDSIVFVVDVVSVKKPAKVLAKADGADQPVVEGLPTVTLADNGAPTITVPKTPAPTELKISALKKGTGAEVKDGATVTVHYTGVIWDTNAVFDSSWDKGQPVSFTTSGVIPGFSKALVGQTVGSQVLAVIPPAEGYGDAGSGSIKGTDTIVFVVDILATE